VAAARALLGDVQILVEEDRIVRAGVRAQLAARALVRIDDHDAVVAFDDGAHLALLDAGRVVAVLAHFAECRSP
jgi:hypothetical protein